MRVVADTNVVVLGLLWGGPPRDVLDFARQGLIQLFTSEVLLLELQEVLDRQKFADRLKRAQALSRDLSAGYAALADVIRAVEIPPVVRRGPDADAVIACAIAARAKVIATGDNDLLAIRRFGAVEIVSVTELLGRLRSSKR
jgi:putative PIN family toxin of toxin-antitoxin system